MEAKHVLANLALILLFVSTAALSRSELTVSASHDDQPLKSDNYDCVYTVYVRTSKTILGGTDSKISLALYDETSSGIKIKNLEAWGGVMGENHKYYERGNLDIFTGRGPCLPRPVCSMELTSDGSGYSHSWYCNYVEVTVTGPNIPCAQQLFTVDEWLSRDRGPKQLNAIRDNCNSTTHLGHGRVHTNRAPLDILLPSSA